MNISSRSNAIFDNKKQIINNTIQNNKKQNNAVDDTANDFCDLSDENFHSQIDLILNNKNDPDLIINKIEDIESNLTINHKDFVKLLKIISNLSNDNNMLKSEIQNIRQDLYKIKKNQTVNINPENSKNIFNVKEESCDNNKKIFESEEDMAQYIEFHINSQLLSIIETFDKKITDLDKKIGTYKSMYMHKQSLIPINSLTATQNNNISVPPTKINIIGSNNGKKN